MLFRSGQSRELSRGGFSLVELLVTMSILAVLLSVLLPSLSTAKARARQAVCSSNLRQLVVGLHLYANDFGGRACPGAADFLTNLHRWHGTRESFSEPFDPHEGPLSPYIGNDGAIRSCPDLREVSEAPGAAFELGNGGYGYNNAFIGREIELVSESIHRLKSDRTGAALGRISSPADTLVFADSAFAAAELIEYSFAEPRYEPTNGWRPDPSIHFRHQIHANVAWVDGHVDARRLTDTWSSGLYAAAPSRFTIGWFGDSDDNRFFDLE